MKTVINLKQLAIILFIFSIAFVSNPKAIAQSNNNGKLDSITEFTTIVNVSFKMPDGVWRW
jgi:hypothetical protein